MTVQPSALGRTVAAAIPAVLLADAVAKAVRRRGTAKAPNRRHGAGSNVL